MVMMMMVVVMMVVVVMMMMMMMLMMMMMVVVVVMMMMVVVMMLQVRLSSWKGEKPGSWYSSFKKGKEVQEGIVCVWRGSEIGRAHV